MESGTDEDDGRSEWRNSNPRMPGVHFVTAEWWDKTASSMENECKILEQNGTNDYCYDEFMLGRIVLSSGLNLPIQEGAKLWRHHGIHLGDWRINMHRKGSVRPDTFAKMHIRTLLDDQVFMELAEICSGKIELIGKIIKSWPMLFK